MHGRSFLLAAVLVLAPVVPGIAQTGAPPLYRVFLSDGTALASFGEWARVDDRVIFSMPTTPDAGPGDLHLVSLPVARVDLARTERYAERVRASQYAATRGEADFAQLSTNVAHALNQVALIKDPIERFQAAERARRALADWPGGHYGYRASEVREILGVLDEVIASLRASAGQNGFDLQLSATTIEPPDDAEPLLGAPDHTEVVQNLMTASNVVESPAEKVSLLQSVVALIDRAVDALPAAFASTVRASALSAIAEEQRIDLAYARLRATTIAEAMRHAARADVRGLERLRNRVREQDAQLGSRRGDTLAGVLATVDAHLDAAHRLRLAHDQWLLKKDRLRAYQRAAVPFIQTLAKSRESLDDIRALAGPPPRELRPLALKLSRGARRLALVQAPAELTAVHAAFRDAFALAENAVQLRLDAAAAADVELARQASSAASGAMMLLARARADLESALRPPNQSPARP